jgi:sugar phosphate isomerase/epimerase
MFLALNTFVYEVARDPAEKALASANRFGFRYVEYAAYHSGDPTLMSAERRKAIRGQFADLGLSCSQLLLANTEHLASPNPVQRRATLDYMKACGDFALELGGRQVLVCWGCGVHQADMLPEQAWLNTVASLREYATWALPKGLLVDLELDPHVYFVVNNMVKMAQVIEDVGLDNLYPNVDIGHLCITREGPHRLDKLRDRLIHVHLSETDTYAHTNAILGTGKADFRTYVEHCEALGIEANCARLGEPCVAGIEMGEPGGEVDDADRWVRESLDYIKRVLPEVTL